jgi:hypothetical protein
MEQTSLANSNSQAAMAHSYGQLTPTIKTLYEVSNVGIQAQPG